MIIKKNNISTLKKHFKAKLLVFFIGLIFYQPAISQNFKLRALLIDSDSFTRIPFAVVSLKGKTIATSTDERGYFEIDCSAKDTLIIRHVSYELKKIPIKKIADSSQNKVKIYLSKKENTISQVTINGNKLSKEKKEEYQRHIDRVRPTVTSPISFLYEELSRKGRERKKMDEIYSQLLQRDAIEQRIPPRKLYMITNDRSVTVEDLLIICPVTAEFVKNASDYDFYYHFSKCWEWYKKGH